MRDLLGLIGFVKPLKFQMLTAILCGTIGHILAISIPVLSIITLLSALEILSFNVTNLFLILGFCSVFRGVFAYFEQQRNHYIAFTVLAIIRDRIFSVLRKLAPAKLDGKDRGNLISIITSDIELLEVFFAHTISPIIIATLVMSILATILFQFSLIQAIILMFAHILIGFIFPILRAGKSQEVAIKYREKNGELSGYYLDSLRGLDEVLQMQNGQTRLDEIENKTNVLENFQKDKANLEGKNNAIAEILVYVFGAIMLIVSSLTQSEISHVIIPTVIIMSSFGPVLSLNKLTVGLGSTVASAKRVTALLNEKAEIEDVLDGENPEFDTIDIKNLTFAYGKENILDNVSLQIKKDGITSIFGKSGSGKSTMIKLLMRFFKSDGISISGVDLNEINTKKLRKMQSYMTQDTDIFASTIKENIKIGNLDATDEEIINASKKASLHDFVMTLENGYETKVGELGDTLSGGEKQRIGLARAFLHDGDLLILDEPTSNLDSLNESVILNSIKNHSKTTILISHRKSTLGICDNHYEVVKGKI